MSLKFAWELAGGERALCPSEASDVTDATRRLTVHIVAVCSIAIGGPALAQNSGSFDGHWTTVVTCPAAEGAGSFTILVDADVKDGAFAGEKGEAGKPGWYSLKGTVQPDGTLQIFARGIVPSSRLAA
jgi:hypothetical protein